MYSYVDNISQLRLSVYFWQKVSRGIVCYSIFYYSKKWINETVLSFMLKMNLNVQGRLKCLLWHLASILRAEHKFICGITGIRKVEKMPMTMLVLVAWAHPQPVKTLNQWRKWFWIIVESLLERLLMMLIYRSSHDKQILQI